MSRRSRSRYERAFPHGLLFHRFRRPDELAAPQGALSAAEFDDLLQFAGIDDILAPDEWMRRLAEGELEPTDLCITFDDGLASQVETALPVLQRHGLKAFWFVYTCVQDGRPVRGELHSHAAAECGGMESLVSDFLRRCPRSLARELATPAFDAYAARMRVEAPFYSTSDLEYRFLRNREASRPEVEHILGELLVERGVDLQAIAHRIWIGRSALHDLSASGHRIGLHTHDHPYDMTVLGLEAQREQYEVNARHVRAITGLVPDCMAHPLNSYNADTLVVLEELGIQCGFRANTRMTGSTRSGPSALEMPREDAAVMRRKMEAPG